MKRLKKILKWTLLPTAALAAMLAVLVPLRERRTYDRPTPAIAASQDPAVIARGRYLVFGAAHCASCHSAAAAHDAAAGADLPLSGGVEFRLPIGVIRSANITSDRQTGVGAWTDGQLARALRHGVGANGRALAPFMPFSGLSDEDLGAIISYLRTQPPVRHDVVRRELNVLGHLVAAFVLEPQGPKAPPAARQPAGPTAAYGAYLAHNVANCVGCHTNHDMRTGAFTGAPFAGGLAMTSDTVPGARFVTPNLTPDEKTGRIANWTEDLFVARFRQGRGAEGSPMPWASFARMNDDDLRAIYRHLRAVPAVENATGDSAGPKLAAAR